jgi:hypothetical protein
MSIDQLQSFFRPPAAPALDDTADLPVITAEVPVPPPVLLPESQMTHARQFAEALQHAWRASRRLAREEHEREGSWLHKRKVEQHSYQAVRDYAHSRAWVPEGRAGGIAEKAGDLYFVLGRAKAAYHIAQLYKCERPARQSVWWVIKFAIAMVLLVVFRHGRLAAEITAGVVLAAVLLASGQQLASRLRAALAVAFSRAGEEQAEDEPEEEEYPS